MGSLLNVGEVIEFAIYIEQNGYKFYVETIKKFKEKKLVDLFQYLADEEFKHEQTFKNLLKKTGSVTPHESYPGEYAMYMKDFLKTHALANEEVLKQKLEAINTIEDAINMALDFEKDSVVLFTMLEKYVEGENKKNVETIIQEELNHILRITRYRHGE
ncbi:MAG: ferritin family protein [Candidatus Aminicenantes bacterium]|nr:MAG: ferritin family protein [Candidatus Aminicenantes bacterium]